MARRGCEIASGDVPEHSRGRWCGRLGRRWKDLFVPWLEVTADFDVVSTSNCISRVEAHLEEASCGMGFTANFNIAWSRGCFRTRFGKTGPSEEAWCNFTCMALHPVYRISTSTTTAALGPRLIGACVGVGCFVVQSTKSLIRGNGRTVGRRWDTTLSDDSVVRRGRMQTITGCWATWRCRTDHLRASNSITQ